MSCQIKNLNLKIIGISLNHEQDCFNRLSKQEQLLKDAENQTCRCQSCGLSIDQNLQRDILDFLNSFLNDDFLVIAFKNNQVVNDLILRSLRILINGTSDYNTRKSSFSLFNQLLTLTSFKKEYFGNSEWYKQSIKIFILDIIKHLNALFSRSISPSDYSFQNEIISLVDHVFDFVEFQQLQTDFLQDMMDYLFQNINDSNVHQIIEVINKLLNKITRELWIGNEDFLWIRIKFLRVCSKFKDIILCLMNDFEVELVRLDSGIVLDYMRILDKVKNFHRREIITSCSSVYNKLLCNLNKVIDNLNDQKIETVKYYARISLEFLDSFFSNRMDFKVENELFVDLMVKILINCKHLDLDKETHFEALKLAYSNINHFCLYKIGGITFGYIYPEFSALKTIWSETIRHRKGYIAFKIIVGFLEGYESTQLDVLDFFTNTLLGYIENKDKNDSRLIEEPVVESIIGLLSYFNTYSNDSNIVDRVNKILSCYFRIGKRLNLLEWDSSFHSFNSEFNDLKFEFITKNEFLDQEYFEMTYGKLKIDEFNKFDMIDVSLDWSNFSTNVFCFVDEFLNMYKSKLSRETKYEAIEFLEYMYNLCDPCYQEYGQKAIDLLINLN